MKAQEIVTAFEGFRMPPTFIDEFNQGGREQLLAQITPFVEQNKTIEFMMLGYPFKSTNHRDKTIGTLPDLAEEISLMHFGYFGRTISEIYPPGVHIHLVSDGFVFNDLLDEQNKVVEEYAEVTKDMARQAPVQLVSLRDFYPGDCLTMAREKLMTHFGITDVELESRIILDHNVNALYRGMIRFMEEELAFRSFASKRQHHLAAKTLAKKMMFRNEAYSHLASHEFPSRIRLSMHPTTNRGKYSFQLIPSPKAWTSPWHCALLIDNEGDYATVHKKDAEAAGHELVERGGRPFYYQAK